MHNASMIEKQAALLSLASVPVVLFWDKVKQDSSSVRTVVWFQRHNRKPTPHHQ
jgi:hypothetical protein